MSGRLSNVVDTRGWPWIGNPSNITPADHAAHTTPKGIAYPEDLGLTSKHHKPLLKLAKNATMRRNHGGTKRKKFDE